MHRIYKKLTKNLVATARWFHRPVFSQIYKLYDKTRLGPIIKSFHFEFEKDDKSYASESERIVRWCCSISRVIKVPL